MSSTTGWLPRVVMLDPGNFIPYYVDHLCRSLREELDLAVHVITSPPLFERVDPAGLYEVDQLFSFRVSTAGGALCCAGSAACDRR